MATTTTKRSTKKTSGNSGRTYVRPDKVDYPGLFNEAGERVKLTSPPSDFTAYKHNALKKEDFEAEDVYWDWKAAGFQAKADAARTRAESIRRLGEMADNKDAMKLLKLQAEIAKLRGTLEGQNVDVEALLGLADPASGDSENSDAS